MLHLLVLVSTLAVVEIDEITVVARRTDSLLEVPVAVTAVKPGPDSGMAHPNQLLDSVPGAWVSRGSGQEHLTAIRSPVLTGAGACGAFLYLDDGIPIRPPGFCNVNNLFELNLAQAGQVEVLRGPAPALYGSNGLHGVINVRPAAVVASDPPAVSFWIGPDQHRQLLGSVSAGLGGGAVRLDAGGTSTGSFRSGEGYDEQKLNLGWRGLLAGRNAGISLAATNINQETAGFIFGPDAWRDSALRTGNLNPEAYRDARAVRLSGALEFGQGDWQQVLRPFLRSSRMQFLQHFLPGKPLEDNGQDSAGLQWLATLQRPGQTLRMGVDVDVADGFLREFQSGETIGSAFLRETRPAGLHYDFVVRATTVAAYGEIEQALGRDWQLQLGLRGERSAYRYDNLALTGNTRDDGSACGFGGCLYSRPADRRDRFSDWAPKLSLSRRSGDSSLVFARLASGFRAPQVTELYRLQQAQSVADLQSEKITSAELGWRWFGARHALQVNGYYLAKRHFIFRDSGGLNVSDGRTRHRGLEWDLGLNLGAGWRFEQAASYAVQQYAFSRAAGGGEIITSGNAVDTAPRWLGHSAVRLSTQQWAAALEWVHQGSYFLDAANSQSYAGHDLLNLQWQRTFRNDWQLQMRLENVANRRYAERADFAFGDLRYFPGAGRQLFVGMRWRPARD